MQKIYDTNIYHNKNENVSKFTQKSLTTKFFYLQLIGNFNTLNLGNQDTPTIGHLAWSLSTLTQEI